MKDGIFLLIFLSNMFHATTISLNNETHIFVICSVKKRSLFYIVLNILIFQGRHRTHKPGTEACHKLALLLHSTIGSCDVIEAASWWVVLLFCRPRPSHILSHAHNSPHCYCDITEGGRDGDSTS